ncbi:calcium-binding protein [Falsiruegeria mediterranea]|uniref:Bifunctional hemolysin/adenylate cyclase n=1 Tax=Falsiruegeria mediterranea M17 TaxID=1200281 RepID=A0A2R8CF34_9RHOB|nr:calcium-binding protein [Falsiruegeria mediterranea]SPJ31031.1 Bifunctional hemolysin/adenylate cyclase [Falsiruegeria mediterranea M17]
MTQRPYRATAYYSLSNVTFEGTQFRPGSTLSFETGGATRSYDHVHDVGNNGILTFDSDYWADDIYNRVFTGYTITGTDGREYGVFSSNVNRSTNQYYVPVGGDYQTTTLIPSSGVSNTFQYNADAVVQFVVDPRIATYEGDSFLVNTYTPDYQWRPKVAALTDGGFVITWISDEQDGSDYGVYAQLYDGAGTPVGDEFRVNDIPGGNQTNPVPIANPDGGFTIFWISSSVSRMQRYEADGTRVGEQVVVDVNSARVFSADQSGNFLAGHPVLNEETGTYQFGLRLVDAQGSASNLGSGFEVETVVNGNSGTVSRFQMDPLSDGGFLATWQWSRDGAEVESQIRAQRLDADGDPVGDSFAITELNSHDARYLAVAALTGGGFAVVWDQGDNEYVLAFDGFGTALSDDVWLLPTWGRGGHDRPAIVALRDGSFLVAWEAPDDDVSGIWAQRFDATGVAQGAAFTLNLQLEGNQWHPALAELADGNVVATWAGLDRAGENTSFDVVARILEVNSAPSGELTLSGTAREDQTLTGQSTVVDPDGIEDGTVVFEWLRNGEVIALASGTEFTLSQADVGAQISWQMRYTDGKGRTETVTSDFVVPENVNDAPIGGITIFGDGFEDTLHAVDRTLLRDEDGLGNSGAYVYQWFSNGIEIPGQTSSLFRPLQAHVNTNIHARLTYVDEQGTTETLETPARRIENVNDAPEGTLTFSGPIGVGLTQRADVSTITDEDGLGTFTFRWSRDFQEIAGATGQDYTLTADDLGKTLRVRATYVDGFGGNNRLDSEGVLMDNPGGGEISVTGLLIEGQTVQADISQFSDPDGTGSVAYQWYRNSSAINGATDDRYTLNENDIGQAISVEVLLTDPYGGETTGSSPRSAPVGSISPTARGSEIQVTPNVNPPVEAGVSGYDPAVIALSDDNFAIFWAQQRGTIGATSIIGQRYDGEGTAVGESITVAQDGEFAFSPHSALSALALTGGGAIVLWEFDANQNDGPTTYRAQRIDQDFSLDGADFEVISEPQGEYHDTSPRLVALPDGGFLVAWKRHDERFSVESFLMVQSYDANGTKVGPERQISASELGSPTFGNGTLDPDLPDPQSLLVASNETGALVTYVEQGLYENQWGNLTYKNYLFTQKFDATGAPEGGLNQVEISEAMNSGGLPYSPVALASHAKALTPLADGTFLYVTRLSSGFLDAQYRGTILTANGTVTGREFDFEMPPQGTIRASKDNYADSSFSVVPLDDGGFLLIQGYHDPNRDTDNYLFGDEVFARRFDALGDPVGRLLKVNSETRGPQDASDAAILSDGTILAAWKSEYSASGGSRDAEGVPHDIRAQLISAAAVPATSAPPITGTEAGEVIEGTPESDQINAQGGNDWIRPLVGNDTIDGGAGIDMVDFSTTPVNPARTNLDFMLSLDLGAGTANIFGGDVNRLTNVENVTGTIFADVLTGDAGNNRLRGLGDYDWFIATEGNDSLEGGNGLDMVSFANWGGTGSPTVTDILRPFSITTFSGVRVDLADPSNNTNLAAGQTFDSIERITGSSHQDIFFGNGEQNDFRGLGGYDFFVSSDGGRERYFGGAGIDTVSYFNAPSGVIASLRNGPLIDGEPSGYGTAGYATRDLYFSIENFIGSRLDDQLIGNDLVNQLRGLQGDDFIFGYGGNDRIRGDQGDDTLDGGAGSDFAIYGGNRADYSLTRTSSTQVTVSGPDGTDSLANIEYFVFDDETANIWELSIV